jgi:2-methylcitrate dehydratase PrpD
MALKRAHGITAGDVKAIRVDGYKATVDICANKNHSTPFEGRFSVPYLIATSFTHGNTRLEAFTEPRLADPETAALARKVEVYLDADIDAEFPHRRAALVAIETTDGAVHERYQPTRIGDPDAPLTDDQLSDKFIELVAPVTGVGAAETLLAACWSLETLASIRDLPIAIGRDAQAAE